MYDVFIIAPQRYGEPAKVRIERQTGHLAIGFIPEQGNQPVSILVKNIGYIGNQAVVRDEHIQHERV